MLVNSKGLYPFILHFGGFVCIKEAYFFKYCRFCNFDPSGGQFRTNLGYLITYLVTVDKLGNDYKSWLQMQTVYIHSDITLVDFWALVKHIFSNIYDFVNLTPLGAIIFKNGENSPNSQKMETNNF